MKFNNSASRARLVNVRQSNNVSCPSATFLRLAVFVAVVGLLASSFYFTSSAANSNKDAKIRKPASVLNALRPISQTAKAGEANSLSAWNSPVLMLLQSQTESITTYAADCTTPKTDFNLGDVVCAKATGVPVSLFPWRVLWVDPEGFVRQSNDASPSDETEYQFTVPSTPTSQINAQTVDNRGTWRANLVRSNGAVRQTARFVVHEPNNPVVDVFVQKFVRAASSVPSGDNISFSVIVGNAGPDQAMAVHLLDSVPAGGTLVQFTQNSGPPCVEVVQGVPNDCVIAAMTNGDRAEFTAIYNTGSAAPGEYETSATVSSTTTDTNPDNNSSTAPYAISPSTGGTTCQLICPDNINAIANTTENEQRGAHVSYDPPVDSGDCGSVSSVPASGSFFPVGTTVVTATSETGNGSCSFTVTVFDSTEGPTISCPSNQSVDADPGACNATVDPGSPTTTGDSVTVTGARDDGESLNAPYPGGTTTIVWTATDNQGRTASCSQTITVNTDDTTPPTITAPANVSEFTGTEAQSCGLIVGENELGQASASDNCGSVNVSRTGVPPGNFFPVGTTTVTYTATDGGGNTATATQTVTITDNSPPTITATAPNPNPPPATEDVPIQDVTVHTGPNSTSCEVVVSDADLGNVQVRDNCAGATLSRTPSGNTFPVGTTTITWSATDANGNTGTAVQNVTVIDDTLPTITAPADVTAGTGPGRTSCDAEVDLGTSTANDNCTFTVTHSPEGPYPLGTTTVTWTITDASGNSATDTQDVTVTDTTPPAFTTTAADSSASADANCQATVPDYAAASAASDNCSSATLSQSPAAGTLVGAGSHTVTVTATDGAGNTSNDEVIFTVNDTTAPVITCPANITTSTDPGMCSANINPGTATATDNCGTPTVIGTRSDNQALNAPYPEGTTTITWTATDGSNNSASCTQTITVNDTEPPAITCPANITLEATCPTGAVGTYTTPTGTDNCPGATTTRTEGLASGSVFPIGSTTVEYTVTDAHGHSTSCSFTVTVLTPQAVLENLKISVSASSLSGPQKNGLISKLDAAINGINNGQTNVACPKLSDFVNSVENLIDHGNISAAQGNAWINSANNVRNTIGCTNNPCT